MAVCRTTSHQFAIPQLGNVASDPDVYPLTWVRFLDHALTGAVLIDYHADYSGPKCVGNHCVTSLMDTGCNALVPRWFDATV
jgi:hypothetical protein